MYLLLRKYHTKRKMRILHINCNYIGTTLHQLMIESLDTLGIENEVFVPTYNKNIAVIEVNDNVFVSECFKKSDRLVFDYKQAKIINSIEEHYDIASFDLIHAYTLFTDGNVARILSKKYNVPYIVAVRNTDVNAFFRKRLFLRKRGVNVLLSAKRVLFLSESYKKQVFEKYLPKRYANGIDSKTEIIPNGIDNFWFDNTLNTAKQIDWNCINLVYAGGIDKNKNITATQKAMAILREKGIKTHLTVVGKIKERAEYERVIEDKYTTYIPAQPKEELLKIYNENDIFVMPSIHESFGLVYAEAMSQGLPVIYSEGQGFDAQFSEGTVGYHVLPNDYNSLSNSILKICDEYERISKNNVAMAKRFNWNDIAICYYEIYQSCANVDNQKYDQINQ